MRRETHKVHDVNELRQRATKVWHGLRQSVINDTMAEWHKRLWTPIRRIHAEGGHYEHLVRFKSTLHTHANVQKQTNL